jgi:hypothetical protein
MSCEKSVGQGPHRLDGFVDVDVRNNNKTSAGANIPRSHH